MASIAAQLKDMFFVLVERVTGYGRDENQKNSAGNVLTMHEVTP